MMRAFIAIVLLLPAFSGCTATIKEWYVMPERIDRDELAPVWNWAGVQVTVVDGRPRPATEPVKRWVDAGLDWDGYSEALVQETRRALLEALGPAKSGTDLELRVSIREHITRFEAPNWVGSTVLEGVVFRGASPTDQRWTTRGRDVQWNWLGMDTARAAAQKAYESAVKNFLRRLALTRPPGN